MTGEALDRAQALSAGVDWGALSLNLAGAAGAAFAVMLVTFAVAAVKGLHRIVDVAWGVAFAAVALTSWLLSAGYGDDGRRLGGGAAAPGGGVRRARHIPRGGRGPGGDPRDAPHH
ncbi:hypothetical protein ACFWWM_20595, partial [Streptomyces sp. NPDC058682]